MDAAIARAEQLDKLKEFVLLVCKLAEKDETFGMVKLNKIMFNAEFHLYAKTGHGVTGAEYQALDQGPALRKMLPLVEQLDQESALGIKHEPVGELTRARPIALREPDLGWFSGEEIAQIQGEVEAAWGRSAAEMSEVSHEFVGWKLSRIGETIPYETVFAMKPRPLTERERNVGLSLIEAASSGAR